ncbi:unnamed protein product, partial [Meganyctiphanes norvegica]
RCCWCPHGIRLDGEGVHKNKVTITPKSCHELDCYFGARCMEHKDHAECQCDAQCPEDSIGAQPVCGSDFETYGSECHLRQFSCRYQRDVVVDALGPCTAKGNQTSGVTESPLRRSTAQLSTEPHKEETAKATRHLLQPEYVIGGVGQGSSTYSLSNSIFNVPPTPVTITTFGLLGSICHKNSDCSIPESFCQTSICICNEGYIQSVDRHSCLVTVVGQEDMGTCALHPCQRGGTCREDGNGKYICQCPPTATGFHCENELPPPYQIPGFSGISYLEVKKIKAYNKVQVELEFRTFTDSGILLYTQQQKDGTGDFISLAIVKGFVEFRYNLGSGPLIIRSPQRIQKKKFHRVVAKRYQKDGILQVEGIEDAIGKAPGNLKSLDLRGSTYIGYVPHMEKRISENIGTSDGLVGCLRLVRINGRPLDLVWPGSPHVVSAEHIGECSNSPCAQMPCENHGSCRPIENGSFRCICMEGYSGDRCEIRLDPCYSQPCLSGATCVSLPFDKFMCKCPPGRTGSLCDQMDKTLRQIVIPDFDSDAYLELPTLENVGLAFALEVWFLTRSPDGVILYNGQEDEGGISSPDFISLNLRNGHVEFTYNLGSGLASLVSPEAVSLNSWHVVRVRRKKRRGTLQLDNGRRVKGKTGSRLTELNLDLPLYLGGLQNYTNVNLDTGISVGLNGAIQRLIVNSEVFDNLGDRAIGGQNVRILDKSLKLSYEGSNELRCRQFMKMQFTFGKTFSLKRMDNMIIKKARFESNLMKTFVSMIYFSWSHIPENLKPCCEIFHLRSRGQVKICLTRREFSLLNNQGHLTGRGISLLNNIQIKSFKSRRATVNVSNKTRNVLMEVDNNSISYLVAQTKNQYEIRFRATSPYGLLLWINKGDSLTQDYLALAINDGFVQMAFNLGKQHSLLLLTSKVRVDDGQWHHLVAYRRKRLGVLRVDKERPVKTLAAPGATTLNTNGKLWIEKLTI